MSKLFVDNQAISVMKVDDKDYISLTDMIKAKDGDFFISDWLRNRNTVESLGVWEQIYNPNFNYGEYAIIRSQAGLNSYKISVKECMKKTGAIGLRASAGRYGGTYAYKDIAFEFGIWISPHFKIYHIKEFERMKADEQQRLGWDIKRNLAKINYRVHTDVLISQRAVGMFSVVEELGLSGEYTDIKPLCVFIFGEHAANLAKTPTFCLIVTFY